VVVALEGRGEVESVKPPKTTVMLQRYKVTLCLQGQHSAELSHNMDGCPCHGVLYFECCFFLCTITGALKLTQIGTFFYAIFVKLCVILEQYGNRTSSIPLLCVPDDHSALPHL